MGGNYLQSNERENIYEYGYRFENFAKYLQFYWRLYFLHSDVTNHVIFVFFQEVSETDFKEIESSALLAEEYGHECLGVLRIPLYTMQDGHNGLPSFLQNQFAGTSILQVVLGLVTQNIVTEDEVNIYSNVLPKNQSFRKLLEVAIASYKERTPAIRQLQS